MLTIQVAMALNVVNVLSCQMPKLAVENVFLGSGTPRSILASFGRPNLTAFNSRTLLNLPILITAAEPWNRFSWWYMLSKTKSPIENLFGSEHQQR